MKCFTQIWVAILLGVVAVGVRPAAAENLLRNAGFESVTPEVIAPGYNRYGPMRDPVLLRIAQEPVTTETGDEAMIDLLEEEVQPAEGKDRGWHLVTGPKVAYEGKVCLLGNLAESYPWQLEVTEGTYTFSVYARSKGPDVLQLRVQDIRGRKGEIRNDQKKAFTLGVEWQRCVFTVTVARGPVSLYAELLGKGTVWLDAVQFEAGKEATAYAVHPWDQSPPRQVAGHDDPLYPAQIQRVAIQYVDRVLEGIAPAEAAGREGTPGQVALRIALHDHDGKAWQPPEHAPWPPSTGGIPLPPGALFDLDHADVLGLTAGRRPIPNQLRVLSRNVADGSIQMVLVDLASPQVDNLAYSLTWGPQVKRQPVETQLRVTESDAGVEVVTGPLRFRLGRQAFRLFDELAYDGNGDGTFAADEELLDPHLPGGPWTQDPAGRLYWGSAAPVELKVEEQGPLRCSILAKGEHRDAAGMTLFSYELRIHAYAGQSRVRIEHTFVNAQQPYSTVMTGCGIRIRFRPGLFNRAQVNDEERFSLAPKGDSFAVIDRIGLRRWKGGKGNTKKLDTPGWLTLDGPAIGMTAVIREWDWMPPKEFWYDPAAGLDLCVWPRHLTSGLAVPVGVARSHRLWLDFHPRGQEPTLPYLQGEAVVQAAPEVYCDSTVFGKLAVKDPARFPEFETFIERPGEGTFGRFPRPGEYGWTGHFIHYGDGRGDMGFGNMETMLDHCMWLLYVRSLDPWYYRRAFDASLHYRDVDMCHPWGQCRVHSHNHTLTPWDCSHSWIKGDLEHYLLTGDTRSLQVAHEHGRWLLSVPVDYKVATGSRRWTRIVQNLADLYRITGHREYYDSFVARIDKAVELRGDNRDVSLFQLDCLEDDKTSYGRMGMQQYYGIGGVEEMAKATGEPRWRDILLDEMRFLVGSREKQEPLLTADEFAQWGREHGRDVTSGRHRLFYSVLGYVFELTGEQKWLDADANAAFYETTRSDWKDWWPNQSWADNVLAAYGLFHVRQLGMGADYEREIRGEALGGALPAALRDPDFEAASMSGWAASKEVAAARNYSYVEIAKDDTLSQAGTRSLSFHETRLIGLTKELDHAKRAYPLELTGNQILLQQPGRYLLTGYVRFKGHGRPNVTLHIDSTVSDERQVVDARLPERLPRATYEGILGLDGNQPAMGTSLAKQATIPGVDLDAFAEEVEGKPAPLDPESVWWRFSLPFELTTASKVRVLLQYCYGLMPPGQVWFDSFELAPGAGEATVKPVRKAP